MHNTIVGRCKYETEDLKVPNRMQKERRANGVRVAWRQTKRTLEPVFAKVKSKKAKEKKESGLLDMNIL